MKYKCEKHKSNEGFTDDKNKWHCWICHSNITYKVGDKIILKKDKGIYTILAMHQSISQPEEFMLLISGEEGTCLAFTNECEPVYGI